MPGSRLGSTIVITLGSVLYSAKVNGSVEQDLAIDILTSVNVDKT